MKFRKKPVEIEAIEWDGNIETAEKLNDWSGGTANYESGELTISTLEGVMSASVGDWIIKGIADECYPCKPEIFKESYEKLD